MSNEKKEPSSALAVTNEMPASGGLVPRNWLEMNAMAEMLAKSLMLPEALRGKPADVFAILQLGLELNLKPMQALLQIYVVKGRPGCSAALKRALVLSHPQCEKAHFSESSDKKATYVTKRRGRPETSKTFTIEMAQAAGLTSNPNYKAHPAAMLRARASSNELDAEWPDVMQGMKSLDELREIEGEVIEVRPNRPTLVSSGPPGATTSEAPEAKRESAVPDEPIEEDEIDRIAKEQAKPVDEVKQDPKPTGEPSDYEKLCTLIGEAVDAPQLNKHAGKISAWPVPAEQVDLRELFKRRGSELRKAGK